MPKRKELEVPNHLIYSQELPKIVTSVVDRTAEGIIIREKRIEVRGDSLKECEDTIKRIRFRKK